MKTMLTMPENITPFYEIGKTMRRIRQLDTQLNKLHGISLDEAMLLCCLSQQDKCQGDIAENTGLSAVQASRLLSRLESKELVYRSIGASDRRQMIFSLSQQGKSLLENITSLGNIFFTTNI
jgi:MarR family transcriptional regulator, organic hydroperoxide resistance regulator